MIFNRIVRINKLPPGGPNGGCYTHTVPKLTVMLPDKGEIEFRDDSYDCAPLPSDCAGLVSVSRGRRWHATDGSGTIYISDHDNAGAQQFGNLSGVVITADGTRYRFTGSRCTSITDRNGNRIDITHTSTPTKTEYKDQLGRITKIEQFIADPDNPSVTLAALVTVPGFGGNRYIKLKQGVMSANYRSDITPPSSVCNGTYDPLSQGFSAWCGANPTVLFPFSYGLFQQRIDDQEVLTEVVLSDQRSLRFKYNLFGEVAEAQLPTGGKLWYDYNVGAGILPAGNSPSWEAVGGFHTDVGAVDRALFQRRIFDGSTLLATWHYSYSATDVTVSATSPTEGLLRKQKHYFLRSGRYTEYQGSGAHDGTYYTLWSTGIEWRTEMRNAAGTVLSATEKDWTQRAPVSWSAYPQEQPPNDNRVNQERRYLETGLMAKVETLYDQYNNPIEVKEYDYDQTLKRRTVISYISSNIGFNYQTDDAIHLLRLPESQTIYDGSGNQRAKTITEYDVYTDDQNHYFLTSYVSVSQHDSSYGSEKKTRGNPTRIANWLNTSGGYIYTYPRYDIVGNVVSTKDARGNVSTVSFEDDFGDGSNPGSRTENPATPTYALPTLITSPPPLPGAPAHTALSQYDYATGLLTGFRDRNDVITQTFYNDPFNRPTLVKSALGVSGVESHTKMYYAPATTPFGITLANNDVLTASDQTTLGDANLRSWSVTDGFGRTRETWSRDPQGDVKVMMNYDALSRTKQVSNPFRPSTETPVYTTTAYDLLGRVISVTTPDGAAVSTAYLANSATVTDEIGRKRKSITDALGRLIEVREDPTGLDYQTTYLYDTLDSLVKVTQGNQQRFFMYDSLKRLIRARNPEQNTLGSLALSDPISGNNSWSIGYQYDPSGNLIQKTDARGVVSTYDYDGLHRNRTIDYSNTASINPDITRVYDTATNGKGRLRESYAGGTDSVGANVEHTKVVSYDALGRPLDQRQRFKTSGVWSAEFQTQRGYNRAGAVTSQTYPSGRTVSYGYDNAGRLNSFSGNLGDGVNRNYATEILYSPFGGMAKEKFGTDTPLYNKSFYNNRGELSEIRVGTTYTGPTDTGWQRGAIINHYSSQCWGACSGTDNNGNLKQQDHFIPDSSGGVQAVFVQSYTYDSLNRLQRVVEGSWQQEFVYDRWGNRTIHQTNTWGTGINKKEFTANTNNDNRLGVPAGQTGVMTYDNAGNLDTDTYSGAGSREYDAENRMTRAWGGNNQWQEYTYNADGQRTRRKIDGVETRQVYGFESELLAEYSVSASPSAPQKEYGYRNGQLLVTATMPITTGIGLQGQYFDNMNFTDLKVTRTDATVSFDWGGGTPDTVIGADTFTTRWQGKVEPQYSQTYTFYTLTDDGVRLWVNGQLIIDKWIDQGPTEWSGQIALTAGQRYDIVMEFYENGGGATAKLSWSSASQSKQIIPQSRLYPPGISNQVVFEWLVADHLGTPRMIFDKSGSLASTKRHDYLPFGEELFAGVGGRTIALGYGGGDGVRQQFTSKERDTETRLDYFGARYYVSSHGRFSSPDPLLASGETDNPQTWNRFTYVLNNPLRLVDPSGLDDAEAQAQNKPKQVVDIMKDKVINERVSELRRNAKPLPPGETPKPTTVEQIAGEQTVLENATVKTPEGDIEVAKGYVQPIGLVVLDQGQNIMVDANLTATEDAQPGNADAKFLYERERAVTTNTLPKEQQPNGVFYDVQLRVQGTRTMDIQTKQDVVIKSGSTNLFMVQGNQIRLNDANRTITFTPGTLRRF